jgi:hypothetical protein
MANVTYPSVGVGGTYNEITRRYDDQPLNLVSGNHAVR